MNMSMSLRRTVIGERHVLVVEGNVDLATLPRLSDALTRLVSDAGASTCVVDIDAAVTLDDASLGLLLGAAGRARGANGDLAVVSTDARMRQRLADTGFDRAVRVTSSISAA